MCKHVCRNGELSQTCVGQIEQFVKVTPRSEECAQALRRLGLVAEPQRFAIVSLWEASSVQGAFDTVKATTKWVRETITALRKSGYIKKAHQFMDFLDKVKANSEVLAVKHDHKDSAGVAHTPLVTASSRGFPGVTLNHFAVPLSSNHDDWYSKPKAGQPSWGVEPVVLIDRSKSTLSMIPGADATVQTAIQRAIRQKWYFTRTYSGSNADKRYRRIDGYL